MIRLDLLGFLWTKDH